MKRNICLAILLTVFCCAFLTGCYLGSNNNVLENSANDKATQYIENKYGFVPNVISAELGDVYERGARDAMVTMEYNGREFLVYIYNINLPIIQGNCCDNYQKTDIENAVAQHAEDVYGVRPSLVDIYSCEVYPESFHAENMMFYSDKFYDGSNAFDLLNEYNSFECIIRFVGDVDLVQIAETEDDFFHREGIDILYTSHATEADMNNCSGKRYGYIYYETFDDYVYNCAMYMTGAVEYSHGSGGGSVYEYNISIGQCGDFYYLCSGKDVSEYSVYIAPDTLTADVINIAYHDGYNMLKDVGSDAIYVDGEFNEDNVFYIYYPLDKLPSVPASLPDHVLTLEHSFTIIAYNSVQYDDLNEYTGDRNDVGTYAVFSNKISGRTDHAFRFMHRENNYYWEVNL